MLGNCLGWTLYALMKQDAWIFGGNAPGFFLSVWLNLAATKLLYHESFDNKQEERSEIASEEVEEEVLQDKKQQTIMTTKRTPDPAPYHEHLVMAMVFIWICIVSTISFASNSLAQETQQSIVGITVNIILVFFYGAPLSTIARILQERNTASIHIPTMIMNTLNGTFWMAYGFAINDYFVYAPNAFGSGLGIIQILLCLIFPRKVNKNQQDETQQEVVGQIMADDDSLHSV